MLKTNFTEHQQMYLKKDTIVTSVFLVPLKQIPVEYINQIGAFYNIASTEKLHKKVTDDTVYAEFKSLVDFVNGLNNRLVAGSYRPEITNASITKDIAQSMYIPALDDMENYFELRNHSLAISEVVIGDCVLCYSEAEMWYMDIQTHFVNNHGFQISYGYVYTGYSPNIVRERYIGVAAIDKHNDTRRWLTKQLSKFIDTDAVYIVNNPGLEVLDMPIICSNNDETQIIQNTDVPDIVEVNDLFLMPFLLDTDDLPDDLYEIKIPEKYGCVLTVSIFTQNGINNFIKTLLNTTHGLPVTNNGVTIGLLKPVSITEIETKAIIDGKLLCLLKGDFVTDIRPELLDHNRRPDNFYYSSLLNGIGAPSVLSMRYETCCGIGTEVTRDWLYRTVLKDIVK